VCARDVTARARVCVGNLFATNSEARLCSGAELDAADGDAKAPSHFYDAASIYVVLPATDQFLFAVATGRRVLACVCDEY
jgi:hypothetical protein